MKNFLVTFLIIITLSSCSEFQKALKSEEVAVKFAKGTELYDAGKYNKANRLFAQIVPGYRGKPQAEKLMYMYSNTFYQAKDYYLAAYQFERFESGYPQSEKAEEALFLSAKSYYMLSPRYSKDQTETVQAIEKLQLFINKYPESQYLAEANTLVKELDYKLEKKAFEIAKQYNKIAYFDSSDYEAAIKSFDLFLVQYPGSVFREDAMFYRLDSAYKLAINSIKDKKTARLNTAISFYNSFKKAYPNSQHIEAADKMNIELSAQLTQFSS